VQSPSSATSVTDVSSRFRDAPSTPCIRRAGAAITPAEPLSPGEENSLHLGRPLPRVMRWPSPPLISRPFSRESASQDAWSRCPGRTYPSSGGRG